jgi:cob(I)alamin adenosyltransferase
MDGKVRRYIQIYTGNGKGKTTAAVGQAIRAAGHKLRTLIIMFMKDYPYGEIRGLESLADRIRVEQYGNDAFVFSKQPPSDEDIATARRALARAREALLAKEYDIVILDEICVAVYFKLLSAEDVMPLLTEKPDEVELILTGRYCPPQWIEKADLVSEMKEIKHYYRHGILAREGFES